MTRPMQTVKRFIRPLVDRAYGRRHGSVVNAKGEQEAGKEQGGTLLDHLIESLDGQYYMDRIETFYCV